MAHRIGATPNIAQPTGNSPEDVKGLARTIFLDSIDMRSRLRLALPKDGEERMENPLPLMIFTTAGLPSASLWTGAIVFDSTVGAFKFSNGTAWIVLANNTVTTAMLQDAAVTTAKIADANVTTAKIADDAVTNAKLANMAQSTIKGRAAGAGTGDPTDLTADQVKTILGAPPAFHAHKNGTNQTGVNSATNTTVTFSTELFDSGGHFSSNTWTPPAGLVMLSGALVVTGDLDNTSFAIIEVTKNGTVFKTAAHQNSTDETRTALPAVLDRANGTDAYTMQIFVSLAAGTGTISGVVEDTYFNGAWLGV